MSPRILATSFVASAVLAVTSGCIRSQPEEPEIAAQPAPVEPIPTETAAAVALDSRTRGWESGKRYTYRLKMTTALALGDQANAMGLEIAANVTLAAVTASSESAVLYATMKDAVVRSGAAPATGSAAGGSGGQAALDKVAAEMRGAGCFIKIAGGKVAQMRVPHGFSPTATNTYRAVAAALQFAKAEGDAVRYTAEEYDTTGLYVAEYQRDGDASHWHKRKQRYLNLLAAKTAPKRTPAQIVPQVVASEGSVRLSADGRPELVRLDDDVTINGAQTPIHSKTFVSLESDPPESAPPADLQALVDKSDLLAPDEPYGEAASIAALDEARINGTSFTKVVSRLEQIAIDRTRRRPSGGAVNGEPLEPEEQSLREQSVQEDLRLFEALAALLRQKPETVTLARTKIRAKSPAWGVLVDALSSASTKEALRLLIDLEQSKNADPEVRNRAANALARSSNPREEAIEALKAMLVNDPFSAKALFGLGTYSRRLRDSGQKETAKELGEFLAQRLKLAKGSVAWVTVLRAIANSGYQGALPAVVPYLTHDDESVRVAAVRALQSMQDARVDDLLASILTDNASSNVRFAALESSSVREPSEPVARALAGMAGGEPDSHVRYRAVELMILWMDRRPDLRTALEQIATSDEEGQVRERAKAAL